jgi:hypothetical protein
MNRKEKATPRRSINLRSGQCVIGLGHYTLALAFVLAPVVQLLQAVIFCVWVLRFRIGTTNNTEGKDESQGQQPNSAHFNLLRDLSQKGLRLAPGIFPLGDIHER